LEKVVSLNRKAPEIQYLIKKDTRLDKLIDLVGEITYLPYKDEYSFLVSTIVGQMLSNKVADVLYQRILNVCGEVSPYIISITDKDMLRSTGISQRKVETIIDLTQKVLSNEIAFADYCKMSDDQIIKALTSVKGIGTWSAKMYLIFVLDRKDVLPYEDGAFIQAYRWLYNTKKFNRDDIVKRCKKWSPYSSYAARYLYKALDSGFTKQNFLDYE